MKKEELSSRSKEIKQFIESFIEENGFSPSMREIANALNIKSTKTVFDHINRLEEQGEISRPAKKHARSLTTNVKKTSSVRIPIVGKITAGTPIDAIENIDEYLDMPNIFPHKGETFMLRVSGDSMKNVGIFDKDIIVVRKQSTAINGEIVVAMIDGEATVKRFFKEQNVIRLQPENEAYSPILSENVDVLGVVIGLVRNKIG